MVEKGIKSGLCHVLLFYTKVNDKFTKAYDKNRES